MYFSRERLFEIIEVGKDGDLLSKIYDFFMMAVIILSLLPLLFKQETTFFSVLDYATAFIFIIDYILRLFTADYKLQRGPFSFARYPFTAMALIDLLSILPTFLMLNHGLKVLKVIRLIRTFKVFRVFKGFRYSKNFNLIAKVMKTQKNSLIAVCAVAVGYILIVALIMFNIEPDTYETFFDAVYWATISLTTMGYGDIYATSAIGKAITMISALFGIAIVALPAGIISAGFMSEINNKENKED
jgi:voltage-gated potassium channel